MIALTAAYLGGLGRVFPSVVLSGTAYPFHPPRLGLVYYTFLPLPFFYICFLFFRKHAFIPILVLFTLFFLILTTSHRVLLDLSAGSVLLLLAASWGSFLLAARCACMRSDLVR